MRYIFFLRSHICYAAVHHSKICLHFPANSVSARPPLTEHILQRISERANILTRYKVFATAVVCEFHFRSSRCKVFYMNMWSVTFSYIKYELSSLDWLTCINIHIQTNAGDELCVRIVYRLLTFTAYSLCERRLLMTVPRARIIRISAVRTPMLSLV